MCAYFVLFCIGDWARWKRRGYSEEDTNQAVESLFEQGYIGQTSNGWRYIEDDIDEDYEQERVESRVNWMGHLFVFGRTQFITALQNAYSSQEVVVLELTGLASQVAPMAELAAISEEEFEHLFSTAPRKRTNGNRLCQMVMTPIVSSYPFSKICDNSSQQCNHELKEACARLVLCRCIRNILSVRCLCLGCKPF